MSTLLILNDPPYGTERSFNGLRLAKALAGKGTEVSIFLMADAVACAKAGQKVPEGYYNLELMVKAVARHGEVVLCGTCMDARGLRDDELVDGARRGTLDDLATLTVAADKVDPEPDRSRFAGALIVRIGVAGLTKRCWSIRARARRRRAPETRSRRARAPTSLHRPWVLRCAS